VLTAGADAGAGVTLRHKYRSLWMVFLILSHLGAKVNNPGENWE